MGFGVLVASEQKLLGPDLLGCIAEVRVEQSLDEASKFAVRLFEDVSGGDLRIGQRAELDPGRLLTIAVPVGGELRCLVHGRIEKRSWQFSQGGPGSFVQIVGRDRRLDLAETCERKPFEGRASAIVQQKLQAAGFRAEVDQTRKAYSRRTGTLNQTGSDLDFIREVARRNGLYLWLSYECRATGGQLTIEETAHMARSPSSLGAGGRLPTPGVTAPEIRVNVEADRCPTVNRFQVDVDTSRPARFRGRAQNASDGREDPLDVIDTAPAPGAGGRRLGDVARQRQLCLSAPGDAAEVQTRAESALDEAAWFVKATASTTAHLLKNVLVPHELVPVLGAGTEHSGTYQVASAVHVVTPSDHFMDLELRSKTIGGG